MTTGDVLIVFSCLFTFSLGFWVGRREERLNRPFIDDSKAGKP